MVYCKKTGRQTIFIGILLLLSVSIQSTTRSNTCTFSAMTLQSSSVLPFSVVEHLSQDKNSAYETELDGNNKYNLYGYKHQLKNGTTLTTEIKQFNIIIDILFQIVYVSAKGGCVIVSNLSQLIAFETSSLSFVQVQKIKYTSYTSLRASESCNVIQIINSVSSNPLSIYINSNVYSGTNTPTVNTLFDNTFTFGLDDSNNLYQSSSDSFTILKTFDSTVNLDTPLNVIDKPDSSFVILYSTNQGGDYALVIYDYSGDSILVQQKWTAAQLTGNKVLKVQNGDRFISLMFKDDTGIKYMVTWANNKMNLLTPYSSTQNAMFSGDALINFHQDEVYSYLNNEINVFDIYLPDQLFYLGSFNEVDAIQMALNIQNPTGIYKNYIKYLIAAGSRDCQNTTQNQTDSNQTFQNNTESTIQEIINAIITTGDQGFYVEDSQGNTLNCPTACFKCTDGSTCTQCYLGYVLNNDAQCTPCKGCMQCKSDNRQYCLSCFQPSVLNQNTNQCQTQNCSNEFCQTCTTDGQCTTCINEYSLWNGSCLKCIDGCAACTKNLYECDPDSCNQGYIFLQNYLTNLSQCVPCASTCLSCEKTNLDSCISCVPGYYPFIDDSKIPPSNTCLKCFSNCDSCFDSISCTNCSADYILASSGLKCVLKCSSPCLTCQQNLPNKCLTCTSGYKYNSATKTCLSSLSCNEHTNCTSCPAEYVLKNKLCLECKVDDVNCKQCLNFDVTLCGLCKSGFYLDTIDNSCKSCSVNCTNCFEAQSCIKCEAGSYLVTQYQKFFGYCDSCQSPCLTCYKKKSICQSCISGYTFIGKKCSAKTNNQITSEIDIPLQIYILVQTSLQKIIQDTCSKVEKTGSKDIIFHKIRRGSTIIGATVSASSPATVITMNAGLKSALSAGNNVQGYTFISSTVTANGLTLNSNSNNLGLILGISIPLFIIVVFVIGYLIYRIYKKAKESSRVSESQKNIDPSSQTDGQRI